MDAEKKLIYFLAALGGLALVGASIASNAVGQQFGAAVASLVPELLCQTNDDGRLVLGQPTSLEACGQIVDLTSANIDEAICASLELEKRVACKELVKLAGERAGDCTQLLFSNQTSFAQGAPQATQWCEVLQAGG